MYPYPNTISGTRAKKKCSARFSGLAGIQDFQRDFQDWRGFGQNGQKMCVCPLPPPPIKMNRSHMPMAVTIKNHMNKWDISSTICTICYQMCTGGGGGGVTGVQTHPPPLAPKKKIFVCCLLALLSEMLDM